jgi:hypothetical protein
VAFLSTVMASSLHRLELESVQMHGGDCRTVLLVLPCCPLMAFSYCDPCPFDVNVSERGLGEHERRGGR